MSVKPAKNPVSKPLWRAIVKMLAESGVAVGETQTVILDEVGDEYCAFAVLYVKEQP